VRAATPARTATAEATTRETTITTSMAGLSAIAAPGDRAESPDLGRAEAQPTDHRRQAATTVAAMLRGWMS
jgi:hypothetical protein